MEKVLSWVILIAAGLIIARILSRQNAQARMNTARPMRATRRGAPPVQQGEAMVRCAHCGIHLPRSEAVLTQGKTWCSQEHAKLGVRQR